MMPDDKKTGLANSRSKKTITRATKNPKRPSTRLHKPKTVKKGLLMTPPVNTREIMMEKRISDDNIIHVTLFILDGLFFQPVILLHIFLFHPCKKDSWFQKE